MLIKHHGIAPSEVWKMDFNEVIFVLDQDNKEQIDCSIMLNFERVQNGASKKWLQNH